MTLLAPYDALMLVSFGGPEGPDDVLPFMENVTRGRGIPPERLVEVSAHYQRFGGVSPINGQNRELLKAIEQELSRRSIDVALTWGNRNWHPFTLDALRDLKARGHQRVLAFVTSAFSSASGCRQYREDIAKGLSELGDDAPVVDKVRVYYNHPGFVEPMIDNTVAALGSVGVGAEIAFTAHSIPMSMADTSDYVVQLNEACRLIADGASARVGRTVPWNLVFQSRSGAPGQPWLEPDISDHMRARQADGLTELVVVPVGFISDHMEVVWDLDTQAQETAGEVGMTMVRAATVGTDSRFVSMIVDLALERAATTRGEDPIREALGMRGANHDVCPIDCCPMPTRPAAGRPATVSGEPAGRPAAGRPATVSGEPAGRPAAGRPS
jgi:protoporphyrin/coproporphyrin ferrochelatase